MATRRQALAIEGELLVVDSCTCLCCGGALQPLRRSLPCANVRCITCGRPAQVRTRRWRTVAGLPKKIMGGAWAPQAGLLLGNALNDLFVVLVGKHPQDRAVYALPASAQDARLFRMRDASPSGSRHAGKQVFTYELESFRRLFTRIEPNGASHRRSWGAQATPTLHNLDAHRRSLAALMRPTISDDDCFWHEPREARPPLAFNVVRFER